ncbi:alpha-hydroxy acid oxidase [Pseudarthrobacter sp902506025]|uniref:alpha-hydroxy acid oxidase n=1 Tax=Pseudarthrobacter sp. 902506025 TaxID=3155291 RepID=UPI00344F86D8
MASNKNPGASWEDFGRLRSEWKGNLVIKGITDPEDAARAVDEGADGIFVSNHGGRQFDSQPATIDVLPSIVDAVGGRAEIYLDGGIRRGHDIVKAVALGAKAALAGPPFAYALATDGEPVVYRVFGILQEEFKGAIIFVGRPSAADMDPSIFARPAQRHPLTTCLYRTGTALDDHRTAGPDLEAGSPAIYTPSADLLGNLKSLDTDSNFRCGPANGRTTAIFSTGPDCLIIARMSWMSSSVTWGAFFRRRLPCLSCSIARG